MELGNPSIGSHCFSLQISLFPSDSFGMDGQPKHILNGIPPSGLVSGADVGRIVPIIGSGVFSAGVLGTFMPITTYLIDAYQMYAASALAANTVLRSLTGALLPLAGPAMVKLYWMGRLIVV